MASCLGLYIESNLIKYAKVSKDKGNVRVEAFGIKFYTNVSNAIEQIVEETNSANIPISINLKDESYQYFSLFSQLNKRDLERAVKLEFESYCTEKGYNENTFETRYAFVDDTTDNEKIRVINISANKVDLNSSKKEFEKRKLTTISPLPMTIPNLIDIKNGENVLVVNLEEKTSITVLYNSEVYEVQTFDFGSGEILDRINQSENSYIKSYDILKNTTIYTNENSDFSGTDQESSKYLEDIMQTIYNIVGAVQKIVDESIDKITKIYLTGTLSNINNIDLYFQEYLGNVKCEILKPTCVENGYNNINIKEYIEINSALSLALQGIEPVIKDINFRQLQMKDKLNIEIFPSSKKSGAKQSITSAGLRLELNDFNGQMTKTEFSLIRICIALLIFVVVYISFSKLLLAQIIAKEAEVSTLKSSIESEISKVNADTTKLNNKASEYNSLIEQLNTINNKISEVNNNRDLIPNLLNQIMTVVDETVQITSISNPTDKHIVIVAQSPKYPGLGYFKKKLQMEGILQNVVAGSGMKQDDYIIVTIEGDLP